MHTVFALLCFVVVIHWLIFPYPSGLLHWHCGNLTIAPVPTKQPWWIWINPSCEFIMNDCITTTKQSTTKPCAYFLGYTVVLHWDPPSVMCRHGEDCIIERRECRTNTTRMRHHGPNRDMKCLPSIPFARAHLERSSRCQNNQWTPGFVDSHLSCKYHSDNLGDILSIWQKWDLPEGLVIQYLTNAVESNENLGSMLIFCLN